MPPANTPSRSPASPSTPPPPLTTAADTNTTPSAARPLTPLSYLSSPVPDLAATLHTSTASAEQALSHASSRSSTTFREPSRRSHIDAQRDPRQLAQQAELQQSLHSFLQIPTSTDQAEAYAQQERLRRVLSRLNRLHEPSSASSTAAYSNRTPSPTNRQNLYDWAPGSDDAEQEEGELREILSDLQRQQPDANPDLLRALSRSQLETNRQRVRDAHTLAAAESDMTDVAERLDRLERRNAAARRDRERRQREPEWISLRNRAMVQRARQDAANAAAAAAAASPGTGTENRTMSRYVMDRERSGMSEEEERARGGGWFRPDGAANAGQGQAGANTATAAAGGDEFARILAEARRHDDRLPHSPAETRARQEALLRAENLARQRLIRARNESSVATPPVRPTSATPTDSATAVLENALKYIGALRGCSQYEDALRIAIDHGLATREFFAEKHEDFVMDLNDLPLLPESSWLQPGAVFEGHQHATTASLTHSSRPSSSRLEQINPNYRTSSGGYDHPPGSTRATPFDASLPWQFTLPVGAATASSNKSHDHWPVRVTIHTIDPDKMTVQGTMEAYDVPQHPSAAAQGRNPGERPKAGKKHAPITTYLEGHIIDLRTHSFLTPERTEDDAKHTPRPDPSDPIHFPAASPQHDAQNWLKLPPFADLTAFSAPLTHGIGTSTTAQAANDCARLLLSKAQLVRLQQTYIFMRWKEKCFVHRAHDNPCTASLQDRQGDQDRGHGLTISGFYYVSLRRSDGVVEGLYFDPISTPFQHLRLEGRRNGWGAWEFR